MAKKPLVSICITTYNHENYISNCLDSALNQKCDFEYEIIIGEDYSTDFTRDICIDYANKYSDKIKLLLNSRDNVIYIDNKPTGRYNFINNLKHAKGKYIALLDGDDIWTSPNKLQEQIEILENDETLVISAHHADIINSNSDIISDFNKTTPPLLTDTNFLLKNSWYIPTSSVVFKKQLLLLPNWFYSISGGDYALYLLLTQNGHKVHYSDKKYSFYRKHSGGISNIYIDISNLKKAQLKTEEYFNHTSNHRFEKQISANKAKYLLIIVSNLSMLTVEFWKYFIQVFKMRKYYSKADINRLIGNKFPLLRKLFSKG